jgi:hypothetical protein
MAKKTYKIINTQYKASKNLNKGKKKKTYKRLIKKGKHLLEIEMGSHPLAFIEDSYCACALLEELKDNVSSEEAQIFKDFTLVSDEVLHCEVHSCSP